MDHFISRNKSYKVDFNDLLKKVNQISEVKNFIFNLSRNIKDEHLNIQYKKYKEFINNLFEKFFL